MSPTIIPVERKDPSQPFGRGGDETGTISATGSPERVIRTGWPVRCTFSSTAVQTALNSESVMLFTAEGYHGRHRLGDIDPLPHRRARRQRRDLEPHVPRAAVGEDEVVV
jgi:hypothetical protein